ncbi:probable cysteine protease RD19B isoform X2 [Mercurialis annua]|uniref:probable cysteine protease RD19B isoform X2 n=1 Tax=Mercurialis annua TaxID=3986 RepID=UPI00215E0893|nr:probable cysteine protease RD19B isoform X2 [Mercurialis annua]
MKSAFEYTLKAEGLMREEDYPYIGTDGGACKLNKNKIAAKVSNFSVVSLDEEQTTGTANLVKNGRLAAFRSLFIRICRSTFPDTVTLVCKGGCSKRRRRGEGRICSR